MQQSLTAEASTTDVGTRDASVSGTALAGFFLAILSSRFHATFGDQLIAE